MKWGAAVLTIALLIALVWVSGCADVSFGSQKIGDFGTSPEEKVAVDHFMGKYGDPQTNSGPPHFLEPLVTTGLVNNTPVNNVVKFSKATDKIYFWGFYDNFQKGDPLTLTWTFNGKTVISLQREAGGDFGRAFGEFLKPDTGWATGTHTITISGRGTSETATFEIVDGLTETREMAFKPAGYTWLNPQPEPPAPAKLAISSLTNGPCQDERDCPPDNDCYNNACVPESISFIVDKTTLTWGDPVTFTGFERSNRLKPLCMKLFGSGLPGEGWRFAENVSPKTDRTVKYTWDTSSPLFSGFQKQTGEYEIRIYLGQCDSQNFVSLRLTFSDSGTQCSPGWYSCSGSCSQLQFDEQNCGACGVRCSEANQQICYNSQCIPCPSGGTYCKVTGGNDAFCADLKTSIVNCGACNNQCPQGQTCQNGVCGVCPSDQTSCNGVCTSLQTDTNNCGSCGNKCSAVSYCSNGVCKATAVVVQKTLIPTQICASGTTLCSGTCVNTQTDTNNCGSCGNKCSAVSYCSNGVCKATAVVVQRTLIPTQTCASGTTLCSGTCVNTQTDTNNCGFCGNKCSAIQYCSNGVCKATGGGLVRKTPTPTPTAIKIY